MGLEPDYTAKQMQDAYNVGWKAGLEEGAKRCSHCRHLRVVGLSFCIGAVLTIMLLIIAAA